MSVLFSPDTTALGDSAGWGQWLDGHYFEHRQFVELGLTHIPTVRFPDYDLWTWTGDAAGIKAWTDAHAGSHDQLRLITGVQGFDLANLNMEDEGEFYGWLEAHAQEHRLLRQAFGIF